MRWQSKDVVRILNSLHEKETKELREIADSLGLNLSGTRTEIKTRITDFLKMIAGKEDARQNTNISNDIDIAPESADIARTRLNSDSNSLSDEVECVDCGKPRKILPKNLSRVTRCVACQHIQNVESRRIWHHKNKVRQALKELERLESHDNV